MQAVGLILIIICPWLLLVARCPREHQLQYNCKQGGGGGEERFCLFTASQLCRHFVFIKLDTGPAWFPGIPPILSLWGPL